MFKFELIGHDAEFICRDVDTKQPVSCAEFVQETLSSCVVYPDNVLLEMNTDPVEPEFFVEHIHNNLVDLQDFLDDMGLQTSLGEAQALYPKSELCNPNAHRIGCMPFLDAYMLGVPRTPQPYHDQWRYAGGHIHLAYDKNLIPSHILVKMLDKQFKIQDAKDNPAPRRDDYYGKEGSYREKPYGIEYRALTNAWMADPQKILDGLKAIEDKVNSILEN